MQAWWAALTALEQGCLYAAIPATLVLLIQTALSCVGSDLDLDGDGEPDAFGEDGAGDGFKLITLRGVAAFLAVSGWVGLALSRGGLAAWLCVLLAVQAGVWAVLLLALMMRWLLGLQSDGRVRPERAVGRAGVVYLRVPADGAGRGKVTVLVQERLGEFEAVSGDAKALPAGTPIVVRGVLEDGALVVNADEQKEEEGQWKE